MFDAVRMPRETAAQALLKAMREARDRRPEGSLEPTLGKLSLFKGQFVCSESGVALSFYLKRE